MIKEFLPYETVRNDALKLAYKIFSDGFIPNVIYCSLRGGAYMANVISEYYKILSIKKNIPLPLYAGVVVKSYTDVAAKTKISIEGWTYPPEKIKKSEKILLVDDIFDSGGTINFLVETLMNESGLSRDDIKVAVHDYKVFPSKNAHLPIQPDYWCRRFEIENEDENRWIHYMSHELVGLTDEELENYYYNEDNELREILGK